MICSRWTQLLLHSFVARNAGQSVQTYFSLPFTPPTGNKEKYGWLTSRVGRYSIWVCTIKNFITIYDIIMIYRTESYTINTDNSWHVFWQKYIQQQGLHTLFIASSVPLFDCSNSFTTNAAKPGQRYCRLVRFLAGYNFLYCYAGHTTLFEPFFFTKFCSAIFFVQHWACGGFIASFPVLHHSYRRLQYE